MGDSEIRAAIIIAAKNETSQPLKDVKQNIDEVSKGTGDLKKGLSDVGQEFASFGLSSATIIGAATAIATGLKYAIDEASKSEDVISQLNATIKSTGGTAGMTSEEIARMGKSFQASSTYSDEAVIGMENMLIRMRYISKENAPQITQTILDMAAAMGTDLNSAAMIASRALEAPERASMSLRRAGIILTETQKEQIKTFVELGETEKAQAIITEELSRRFAGSAAAAAATYSGQLKQLENNIGELGEAIGNRLIPILTTATVSLNTLISFIPRTNATFEEHRDQVLKTSKSYQEYSDEVVRSAFAAGKISESQLRLYQAEKMNEMEMEVLIEKTGKLTAAQYDAIRTGHDESDMLARYSKALRTTSDEVDYSIKQELNKEIQSAMSLAMTQKLGEAEKVIGDIHEKNADKLKKLQDELERYKNLSYYADYTKKLTDEIKGLTDQEDKAAAAVAQMTAQIIFSKLSKELDAEATQKLAHELGLMDDKTYHLAREMDRLNRLLKDGKLSQEEYRQAVLNLNDANVDAKSKEELLLQSITRTTDYINMSNIPSLINLHDRNLDAAEAGRSLTASINAIPKATDIVVNTFYKSYFEQFAYPGASETQQQHEQLPGDNSAPSYSPSGGNSSPAPSGGSSPAPSYSAPAEEPQRRYRGAEMAKGGSFDVPAGYDNDTFPVYLSSGEHVSVTPAGAGNSGNPINIVINVGGSVISEHELITSIINGVRRANIINNGRVLTV